MPRLPRLAGGHDVGNLVFAESPGAGPAAANDNMMVFLRGGCDGLTSVSPYDNAIYVAERDNLAVSGALCWLNPQNSSFDSSVGLHPNAAPLKELYDQGHLAIVHVSSATSCRAASLDAMKDYIGARHARQQEHVERLAGATWRSCIDGTLPVYRPARRHRCRCWGDPGGGHGRRAGYSLSGVWSYTP